MLRPPKQRAGSSALSANDVDLSYPPKPFPSSMPPPTTTSFINSPSAHFLFLVIFACAFFPGFFLSLIKFPFSAFSPNPVSQPASPPLTSLTMSSNSWFQKTLTLPSKSRGSYLITDTITAQLPEISSYKVGLLNLFVQHTSCALSLNENWDSEVREDMSDALDRLAPEDRKGTLYRHSAEGLDDMPVGLLCMRAEGFGVLMS